MDSKVYRLTYVADSYDLITHLYFVDRAKAEAMYREKLEKVSFYRYGYIYLHSMKEDADGVLDIDEVILKIFDMIGAIIGDIVGSRFEFNNTRDGNFALFSPECSFTDDTICTVAVADAILRGEDYRTSILRWCRKYPNPMGAYGASFALWLNSPDPQPYNSFGNGAAMRVSPVAYAFDTEQEVIRQAMETAKITHDHPDGIIGAMVVARAIYLMRSCDPFCDVLALNQALEMVGMFYGADWEYHLIPRGKFDETCQGCVPLAFHIIKESDSFEDAIRKAILYGGDSDTLGAIVGSLAKARFGVNLTTIEAAMSYLPEDMRNVIKKFYATY